MEARRGLWTTQVELYRTSGLVDASSDQFLRNAKDRLARVLSDGVTDRERRAVGDSLTEAATRTLGAPLARRIFLVLGPEEAESTALGESELAHAFRDALGHPALVIHYIDTNCNCSGSSSLECSSTQSCQTENNSCNGSSTGCGVGGAYACNGTCKKAEE